MTVLRVLSSFEFDYHLKLIACDNFFFATQLFSFSLFFLLKQMLLSFSLSVMRLSTNVLPGTARAVESRWSRISRIKCAVLLVLESSSLALMGVGFELTSGKNLGSIVDFKQQPD